MIPQYTNEEFLIAKSKDKLPCQCEFCNSTYFKQKKDILAYFKNPKNPKKQIKFCNKTCQIKSMSKSTMINCSYCNKPLAKQPNKIKNSKRCFCSHSCSASYYNKNKSYGTKRSKLELYLEEQLTQLYPNLHIDYNKKDAIGSELDIYIPSLNIAFELNGIFHYEPIYGVDRLQKIQENDISKSKACHDARIDLCVIDTSNQKYVKPSTSKKYLDIITNIINQRTNT